MKQPTNNSDLCHFKSVQEKSKILKHLIRITVHNKAEKELLGAVLHITSVFYTFNHIACISCKTWIKFIKI